jgi:two-component system, chemotaxis family, sensor kinase Cph1
MFFMGQFIDFFRELFSSEGFPARWNYGKWTNFHGWFYIISDTLIWTAYFAIPIIIIRYISHRHDVKFAKLYFLFGGFILACGFTHLLDAIIFWYPLYRLEALVKFITGIISWITVFYLIKNLPVAFSLKTTHQLEEEIALRKNAEDELVKNNAMLFKAHEELITSLENEKKLNELKSRFVSFASHEFRTPLTHILSSAELIKLYPGSEQQDKRNKHIDRIVVAVSNLTDILNDFLSVEHLESGNYDVAIKKFNIVTIIEEIINEIDAMVVKKNQTFSYTHDGTIMVSQSEKVLRNILLNLFSNASKYSPKGGQIFIHSSVTDHLLTLTIKDNGIGIPEEDQAKVFTGYFRGSNVENIQGTGLGLNIVKKYVELLSGRISFFSRLNKGTTFTVELPIHQ